MHDSAKGARQGKRIVRKRRELKLNWNATKSLSSLDFSASVPSFVVQDLGFLCVNSGRANNQ